MEPKKVKTQIEKSVKAEKVQQKVKKAPRSMRTKKLQAIAEESRENTES